MFDRLILIVGFCGSVVITGPPNGPVLFCWLSSIVVCNAALGRRGALERVVGMLSGLPASGLVDGRRAGGRARGRSAADTARRASCVTFR